MHPAESATPGSTMSRDVVTGEPSGKIREPLMKPDTVPSRPS
jgi:hypothetical protein